MRCPHCRGEIPPESQFCGVCGQNIHDAPAAMSHAQTGGLGASSGSLFELPVSKGARLVRSAMILGLNLLLLGGGIALTLEYLHKRDRAARASLPGTSAETRGKTPVADQRLAKALMDAGMSGAAGNGKPSEANNGTLSNSSSDNERKGEDAIARNPNESSSSSGRMDAGTSGRATPKPDPHASATRKPDAGPSANTRSERFDASPSGATLGPEEDAARVRVLAAQISLVVERHQAQLARCYQSASKVTTPDKPIQGRIDVRFSVEGDGRASSVRTSSNDTGSGGLENCLLTLVRSWTFPASGGEALDFVWPFEFKAP